MHPLAEEGKGILRRNRCKCCDCQHVLSAISPDGYKICAPHKPALTSLLPLIDPRQKLAVIPVVFKVCIGHELLGLFAELDGAGGGSATKERVRLCHAVTNKRSALVARQRREILRTIAFGFT